MNPPSPLRRAVALLDRHATAAKIAASVVASVVLGVAPLTYAVARIRAHSPDAAPLDMSSSYTADEAYAMIARYGADARDYYVFNAFTGDVIAPALFGLTIALFATAMLRRLTALESRWRAAVVVLAVAGFAADLVENALLAALVSQFPERHDALAALASAATSFKRVAIFSSWGLALGALVALGLQALRRGRR